MSLKLLIQTFVLLSVLTHNLLVFGESSAQPEAAAVRLQKASDAFDAGQYAEAAAIYQALSKEQLLPSDNTWVRFRLNDARWRSRLNRDVLDLSFLRRTRQEFENLIEGLDAQDPANNTLLWQLHVALADSFYLPFVGQNAEKAQQHYVAALHLLATSTAVAKAQAQYMAILHRICEPSRPFIILEPNLWENACKIASTSEDAAFAQLGLARSCAASKNPDIVALAPLYYEKFIQSPAAGPALGQALVEMAQLLEKGSVLLPDGRVGLPIEPNPLLAKSLYNQALSLQELNAPYYKAAEEGLERLKHSDTHLQWQLPLAFKPQEPLIVHLQTQYTQPILIDLFSIDLSDAVDFSNVDSDLGAALPLGKNWLQAINLEAKTPIRTVLVSGSPSADSNLISIEIPQPLPAGFYIIRASCESSNVSAPLVVGELDLVVQSTANAFWAYLGRGLQSNAVSGADVLFFALVKSAPADPGVWVKRQTKTNVDGLATFRLPEDSHAQAYLIVAQTAEGEGTFTVASHIASSPWDSPLDCFVLADRFAHQSGEKVHYKVVLVPDVAHAQSRNLLSNTNLMQSIEDAYGNSVYKGPVFLNTHNSFSGIFEIKPTLAVGPYFLNVTNEIGVPVAPRRPLFTLERFCAAELAVNFRTLSINGEPRSSFLFGEPIVLSLDAQSDNGTPLARSLVELKVYQDPYDSPYADELGQLIETQTLQIDALGHGSYIFLPPVKNEDAYYTFVCSFPGLPEQEPLVYATVAVTQERYIAHLSTPSPIVKPFEPCVLTLKTTDALGIPTARKGRLCLMSRASGKEEDIFIQELTTNAAGLGTIEITLSKAGPFEALWIDTGADQDDQPVQASLPLWAAAVGPSDAFREAGFSVIIPEEPVRVGDNLPVLIFTPEAQGKVLISIASDSLLAWQSLQQPTAHAQRIDIPVQSSWGKNAYLHAVWIRDGHMQSLTLPITVAVAKTNLVLKAEWGSLTYKPGEKAQLDLQVTDSQGRPVQAEVAVSLTDLTSATQSEPFRKAFSPILTPTLRPDRVVMHSSFDAFNYTWDSLKQSSDPRLGILEADVSTAFLAAIEPSPHLQGDSKWTRATRWTPTTLLWSPSLKTDAAGKISLSVDLPHRLATWDLNVWAIDAYGRFAHATDSLTPQASLDLRFALPDYFIEGDHSALFAWIDNLTPEPLQVQFNWAVEGASPLCVDFGSTKPIEIDSLKTERLTCEFYFPQPGQVRFHLQAQGAGFKEPIEAVLPVLSPWPTRFMGQIFTQDKAAFTLPCALPNPEARILDITLSAPANLYELVYQAVDSSEVYVEGCIEGIVSASVPLWVAHAFFEKAPVQLEFNSGIKSGMLRSLGLLTNYQNQDGGWPWWRHGVSDVSTTVYVLWALQVASFYGHLDVSRKSLLQAHTYLEKAIDAGQASTDLEAAIFHTFSLRHLNEANKHPDRYEVDLFSRLWKKRNTLSAQALARTALGAFFCGLEEEAILLAHRLVPLASPLGESDAMPRLSWPQVADHSPSEVASWALIAISTILPQDPSLAAALNTLVALRKGPTWDNSYETALASLALMRYLALTKLAPATVEAQIFLNHFLVADIRSAGGENHNPNGYHNNGPYSINHEYWKRGNNEWAIEPQKDDLGSEMSAWAGLNVTPSVRVVYDEPIADVYPASGSFTVERFYDRISREPTLLSGYVEVRQRLDSESILHSGEEIEVIYLVNAKNSLKYFVLEDLLPSGFERVFPPSFAHLKAQGVLPAQAHFIMEGQREGIGTLYNNRTRQIHQELSQYRLISAIDDLPAGLWEIRYRLRADNPGTFVVPPAKAHCIYEDPDHFILTAPAQLKTL